MISQQSSAGPMVGVKGGERRRRLVDKVDHTQCQSGASLVTAAGPHLQHEYAAAHVAGLCAGVAIVHEICYDICSLNKAHS